MFNLRLYLDDEATGREEVEEFIKLYPKAAKEMPNSFQYIPRFFTPVSNCTQFLNQFDLF